MTNQCEAGHGCSAGANRAVDLHVGGFNCAEAVYLGVLNALGIDSDEMLAVSVATGLGAGIGRTGRTCGALTGGVLALGLLFGRDEPGAVAAYARTCQLVQEAFDQFESRFGSTECHQLSGYDFTSDIDWKAFAGDTCRKRKCLGYVGAAASIFIAIALAETDDNCRE